MALPLFKERNCKYAIVLKDFGNVLPLKCCFFLACLSVCRIWFICLALVCVPPEAHHLFKVIYFSCCLWYSFSCLFVCLFVESSMFICSIRFAFYFVLFFCLFADLIWTQFIRLES